MPLPANIISLRHLLAARFPEAQAVRKSAPWMPAGIACLDDAGLMAGTLVEIVGETAGCGVGLLLAALLEGKGQEVLQPSALIDGADAFDPSSISQGALQRVLWVRCHEPEQAVRAADLLLRDGNLPRVLLDLQLHSQRAVRRIPSHAWHRLRLLAEKSGVALCIFTPAPCVPCTQSRLIMEEKFTLPALDVSRPVLVSRLRSRLVRESRGSTASAQEGQRLAIAN